MKGPKSVTKPDSETAMKSPHVPKTTASEHDCISDLDLVFCFRFAVKVYKCTSMATDCGMCLTLEPKYNCGWCDSQCTISQQCTALKWLDNSQDCPNPVITRVSTRHGPHIAE